MNIVRSRKSANGLYSGLGSIPGGDVALEVELLRSGTGRSSRVRSGPRNGADHDHCTGRNDQPQHPTQPTAGNHRSSFTPLHIQDAPQIKRSFRSPSIAAFRRLRRVRQAKGPGIKPNSEEEGRCSSCVRLGISDRDRHCRRLSRIGRPATAESLANIRKIVYPAISEKSYDARRRTGGLRADPCNGRVEQERAALGRGASSAGRDFGGTRRSASW